MQKCFCVFVLLLFCSAYTFGDDIQTDKENTSAKIFHQIQKTGFSFAGVDVNECENGNAPVRIESYLNLFSKKKVKSLIVFKYDNKEGIYEQVIKYIYNQGLLISSYSAYSDVDPIETNEYDNQRRIIRQGKNWVYEYLEANNNNEIQRNVLYNGRLYRIEKIMLSQNGYETSKIMIDDEAVFSVKYNITNGLINQIVRTINNRERNWDTFKYEDKHIKEIITATSTKDDIRAIRTVLVMQKSNIQKLEIKYYRNNKVESVDIWTFSNYDLHGNWHDAEWKSNLGFAGKYHRDIEYD